MTASAPSRTAALTAQVIPRSLKEPVGLAPSIFSHTSAPTRSETRSASTSGVEPSPRETTGSAGANGSRSRKRSMSPLRSPPSHELLLDDADGARLVAHEVELADQPQRGVQARLEDRVDGHDQARLGAEAVLDERLDRAALQPEHLR